MNYIFIDSKEKIKKMGIVEDNRLAEYFIEEKNNQKLVGNIYRARILNVLRGMDAAFLNIGEGKNAYLHVKDALNLEQMYSDKKFKINRVLTQGEDIIVQVIKDPVGNKGPKLTTHISIPARFMVLTPYSRTINVSRKISEKSEVKRLKKIGKDMIEENIGLIFRTNAEDVEEKMLIEEYRSLVRLYKKIERQKNFNPSPKLLYKEADAALKLIRDTYNEKKYKIIVNERESYKEILELEDSFSQNIKDNIEYKKNFSVDTNPVINRDLAIAQNRNVALDSGGYIVIDETEALTAIDVNTGKYTGSISLKGTILRTNLEAAEEIARQIKLRNIGGIIIIDFIDMKSRKDISKVLSSLKESFKNDKNKPNLIGITKLGLAEVTRKRLGPALSFRLMKDCENCHGTGKLKK